MDNLRSGRPSTSSDRVIPVKTSTNPSGKFIAIGIDFGTTFSGVSWAFSENPENIREISEWPSAYHNNRSEVQVPTQITSDKWGYEITSDMTPIKWFKLLLLRNDDLKEDVRNSKPLEEGRQWLKSNGYTAVDVVAMYLGKLWDHAYATLKSQVEVDSLPLRVAISIPAIWPHYAQDAMRQAADKAGITKKRLIGETTLDLVQEPEAAGLSILFDRADLPEIEEGESFVVCDAGGGTVDVITYTVDSISPFKVKECVTGQGELCGAVRVDEAFEAHLIGKTKLRIPSFPRSDYNTFIVDDWERGAKRNFDDEADPEYFHLRPPLKLYRTRDRLLSKDNFAISRVEMRTFFAKSMTGIRTLVHEQCSKAKKTTGKPPKHILLVGGLGSSKYIYSVLDKQFGGIVLRPLHAWSAVARGAVIRLLNDSMSAQKEALSPKQAKILASLPEVTARKSRYSYGIEVRFRTDVLSDFDKELDDSALDPEGNRETKRMVWYLRRGDEVSKGSPIIYPYSSYAKHRAPPKCAFWIRSSASVEPPKRNDSSVQYLCLMECAWDKPFSEWKPVGEEAEGWRRYDGLTLAMTFDGELKWKARVGSNEVEHEVAVEYQ
ncbi:hypothetical protein B0T10DRAFT_540642 [Thelonectria olida]|uniref:Actin-like ATPase domain-containing protein n=1 Tax=Thelonectria olida TaxID=1576542 RepID=A0A9P9AMF1_9HYPO|nr:hypothetical protein B0T10DRAFT_540642 [Thelonectria olida]